LQRSIATTKENNHSLIMEKKIFWKLISQIQWQRSHLRTENKRVLSSFFLFIYFIYILPWSSGLKNMPNDRCHEAGIKQRLKVVLKYQLTFYRLLGLRSG
jgi:hypothetical protein